MTSPATARYAERLGDDALVLAQRLIEWTSNAPLIEEELALANTALDYLGRARLCYQYAARLNRAAGRPGHTEDELAYRRDATEFGNALICELPRGDFAFTMARQFLIDAFSVPFLDALSRSSDGELAGIAGKALKESRYHVRRSADWMLRLGDGTQESHARAQRALDALAPYVGELFEMDALERELVASGVAVDRDDVRPPFAATVEAVLGEATLVWTTGPARSGGRRGAHTAHLAPLLAELQSIQREHAGLTW